MIKGAGIILLGFVCGVLLYQPFCGNGGVSHNTTHLAVVRQQLDGLKRLILEYHKRHGRYPDNNEGLGCLDTFESRFPLTYGGAPEHLFSKDTALAIVGCDSYWWLEVQDEIKKYRDSQAGKAPGSMAEFAKSGLGGYIDLVRSDYADTSGGQIKIEIGIDPLNNIYVLGASGVLTPWMEPYLYENRSGLPRNAFSCSLANKDRRRQYSIEVADDIYVYSVGGYYEARDLRNMIWFGYCPCIVGGMILCLCIGVAICTSKVRWLLALPAGMMGLIIAFCVTPFSMCYIPNIFARRDARNIKTQVELLEKYHAKGVINDETYRRLCYETVTNISINAEIQK